jgi:predicted transcriptional regulator
VKVGVGKSGEVGLNITEEDLIETYKVADVMDAKTPTMAAGMSLRELVEVVSSTDCFYYPVVDNDKKLIGAVTLDGIRNTFTTHQLNDWLVALDIMEPVIAKVAPRTPLSEAFENANRLDVGHIAVTPSEEDNTLLGVLDCRAVRRALSTEVLARQQKADNLHISQPS